MSQRILVVDDHPNFRSQARAMLEAFGYEVAGEAGDVKGALKAVEELHPDAILLDIQLPDGDGIALASEIAGRPEAPRVVLVSSHEASDFGPSLEQSAAAGFIHKPDLSRAQLEAILGPAG